MVKQLMLPMDVREAGRMRDDQQEAMLQGVLADVARFSAAVSGVRLRSYQVEAARAIVDSALRRRGLTFVVIFPRQSGKNELQAQIEAYLLALCFGSHVDIVKVSPTWKPQSLNAMRRLERVLEGNRLIRGAWRKEQGYIYRIGRARITFLSGAATSNVVGATASLLLECDEAQDVGPAKWDKELNPMAASANATRVFWGTAWTSDTLLGRELRLARQAEREDGRRRVFTVSADEVRQEVEPYGAFVDGEIARLGRYHPLVRTQYFCEEVDAAGGMFPPTRRALMQGSHAAQDSPAPGETYAFLLDIAGEDESSSNNLMQNFGLDNQKRDSTALTIVRVDLGRFGELHAPVYRVVQRRAWVGMRHSQLFGQLTALAEAWQPRYIICDSTGVGAGLTSFLARTYGDSRVLPFVFTSQSKSKLGWDFLSVIETGRFLDHAPSPPAPLPGRASGEGQSLQAQFNRQLEFCQLEILPGPGKLMRWGVPDGRRDPASGALLHDDLLISAALCAVLDEQTWGLARSEIVQGFDPISGMGEAW